MTSESAGGNKLVFCLLGELELKFVEVVTDDFASLPCDQNAELFKISGSQVALPLGGSAAG